MSLSNLWAILIPYTALQTVDISCELRLTWSLLIPALDMPKGEGATAHQVLSPMGGSYRTRAHLLGDPVSLRGPQNHPIPLFTGFPPFVTPVRP